MKLLKDLWRKVLDTLHLSAPIYYTIQLKDRTVRKDDFLNGYHVQYTLPFDLFRAKDLTSNGHVGITANSLSTGTIIFHDRFWGMTTFMHGGENYLAVSFDEILSKGLFKNRSKEYTTSIKPSNVEAINVEVRRRPDGKFEPIRLMLLWDGTLFVEPVGAKHEHTK